MLNVVSSNRVLTAFLTFSGVVLVCDLTGWGHPAPLLWSVAFCAALYVMPERGWRWVYTAGMVLSIAIALQAIAQEIIAPGVRAQGPFRSPNILGAYAAVMLLLVRTYSIRDVFYTFANLCSVLISQSRGALLAISAGFIVDRWQEHRRAEALVVGVLGVAGVLWIRSGGEEARIAVWRIGAELAAMRPLTGYGQGGIWIGGMTTAYNIPLEWLLAGGVLAIAAGGWLLFEMWRAAPSLRPFLAAWFVQGLFLFGHAATYIPLLCVISYICASAKAKATTSNPTMQQISPNPSG